MFDTIKNAHIVPILDTNIRRNDFPTKEEFSAFLEGFKELIFL